MCSYIRSSFVPTPRNGPFFPGMLLLLTNESFATTVPRHSSHRLANLAGVRNPPRLVAHVERLPQTFSNQSSCRHRVHKENLSTLDSSFLPPDVLGNYHAKAIRVSFLACQIRLSVSSCLCCVRSEASTVPLHDLPPTLCATTERFLAESVSGSRNASRL